MEKRTVLYFLLWVSMLASVPVGVFIFESQAIPFPKRTVVEWLMSLSPFTVEWITSFSILYSSLVLLGIYVKLWYTSAELTDELKKIIYLIILTSPLPLSLNIMYCLGLPFYLSSIEQLKFIIVSIIYISVLGILIRRKLGDEKYHLRIPKINLRSLITKNIDAILLFVVALILYTLLMSCSFNEWDSFNFALALRRFDVVAHQPHPPGFPVYVFLGYIFLQFTGNTLTALVIVSVLSGSLTMFPLYALAKKMGRETAILACATTMILPSFLLRSGKATADMLFTFIITSAAYLLYLGYEENDKLLFASWFLFGIALGTRPVGVAFLPLWLYVTLRRKILWKIMLSLQIFIVSVLLWLVPVVCVTGWYRFWSSFDILIGTAAKSESVFAAPTGLSEIEKILFMLGKIPVTLDVIFRYCLGGTLPTSSNLPLLLLSIPLYLTITLGVFGFRRAVPKKTFMSLWIAPYFVFVYLFGIPFYSRYYLPIIPPLILILVVSAMRAIKQLTQRCRLPEQIQRILPKAFVTILIISIFTQSLPHAITLHTTPAPAIQLVKYVKSHYEPKKTLIITFHEYRAFQYYGQEFRCLRVPFEADEIIKVLKNVSATNKTVLIIESAYFILRKDFNIPQLDLQKIDTFYMDPRVEIENNHIVLCLVTAK